MTTTPVQYIVHSIRLDDKVVEFYVSNDGKFFFRSKSIDENGKIVYGGIVTYECPANADDLKAFFGSGLIIGFEDNTYEVDIELARNMWKLLVKCGFKILPSSTASELFDTSKRH